MKIRTWIYICIMGVAILLTMSGCQKNSNVKQPSGLGTQNNNSKGEKVSISVQAVVKGIDTRSQTITLYDIDSGLEKIVSYNGATEIFSRNKVALLISQLTCGEIVEAYFEGNDQVLAKIQISKEAWEYKKIKAIDLDRTEGIVNLTGRKYKYQKDVAVFYGTEQQMLIDLNERDEITVKGIGDQAYSFVVTKGHGYIRLGGHEDFLGGSITIDKNIFLKVQQNMLIAVGEGEHTVVVENKDMQVVENVRVARNQEYFFDMSTYEPEKKEIGKVKFVISPSNAVLYINGKRRNYTSLISLPYGNYTVTVRAEGYQDYTGILHVEESEKEYETIYVDLVMDNSVTSVTPTPKASTTPAPTLPPGTKRTAKPTVTKKPTRTNMPAATDTPTDDEHKININGPNGASVYVDGVYKGVAPVSFPKVLGDITITLSKTGCQTKSYSVTVDDDGENVEYNFADLIKKE
ncbi:MAG: PEGA domain-containing protein [Lachnospiraceae bacterium]|nr:PEGA domain-containing protein [Lachnospiraceae bacterium]